MKKADIYFELERLTSERILILDGAMGTMIQKRRLSEEEFRGDLFAAHPVPLRGDNDVLCLTQPEVILDIHRAYLEAGADIIETNTFNATAVSQADYKLEARAEEIARAGAALARKACDEAMEREPGRRCFVAGSIGPTSKSLSIGRDPHDPAKREVSFDEMVDAYESCARGLIEGGADILLIETVYDTLNAKAALWALHRVFLEKGVALPVMISATVSDSSGRLLSGQTVQAFWYSVRHAEPFSVGFNCSVGAESLLPFVEEIGCEADCAVSVHPNAGLPNEFGEYDDSPEHMARVLRAFAQKSEDRDGYGANIVGGCCGTTPEHIRQLVHALAGIPPRRYHRSCRGSSEAGHASVFAGLEPLVINPETLFVNIGERCNVAGSRAFARLIREEKYAEAVEVAKAQIEAGAQILDVNMDDPLVDSRRAMARFLDCIASEPQVARVPVMLDSSRWDTLLEGLKHLQGKGIVNSLSLKDGEAVFLERGALVHALGGAILVMAMDEEGQAETFERKIEVCERSYRLLVERLGIPPEDVILDPNIFAIGTGVEAHGSHAVDYLRAVAWIKQHLPGALVSGGVSNLSFAFRGNDALRAALHAVFLYHARAAGMDMGIVNPAQLVPYEEISPEMRGRIEDLVLHRRPDATERLLDVASRLASASSAGAAASREVAQTPEERVVHALVSGTSETLADDIEALRLQYAHALDVIEGPLMKGMNRVGALFGEGKLFLPQVIKSARIMRQAVQLLQPHIQAEKQKEQGSRGKILLATVKGDVHDIGKNIVALILSCNGYDIVDLGVMVTAEQIVEAAIAEKVQAVGLSGLISPSLVEMANVASLMEARGLSIPLLVGGATTSALHTALRIAPCYSGPVVHIPDASLAPGALDALLSGEKKAAFIASLRDNQEKIRMQYASKKSTGQSLSLEEARKKAAGTALSLGTPVRPREPGPSDFVVSVSELVPLVDWEALLRDWEVKGSYPALREDAQAILNDAVRTDMLRVRCAYGIFPAARQGEDIFIYRDESRRGVRVVLHCLRRQQLGQDEAPLSLADFLYEATSGIPDWIGAFAVNAGQGLAQAKRALGAEADDYRSLLIDSLANRLAEAASEMLFRKVRECFWGFGSAGAKGIRPAPGYPTCPDHRDKALIFSLLDAEERLGLMLTESYMMVPAASVCGWYFASPAARYFSVGRIARDQIEAYAARRGESPHTTERWLSASLGEGAQGPWTMGASGVAEF